MRPQTLHCIVAALLFSSAPAAVPAAPQEQTAVRIETSVHPAEVPLNREVQLVVRVTWTGDIDLIEIRSIEEPVLTNFVISGTSSANRVEAAGTVRQAVREIGYTLKPSAQGMAYVESAVLTYLDAAAGKTRYLSTGRVGVKVTAPVEQKEKEAPLLLLILLPFAVLAAVMWFIRRRYTQRQKPETEPEPVIEDVYLRRLKEEIDPETSGRSEAFTHLSKLFRSYLAEKFGLAALEVTTAELLEGMRAGGLEPELIEKCEDIFTKADLVKFSALRAEPAELRAACTTVETFLQQHMTMRAGTETAGQAPAGQEKKNDAPDRKKQGHSEKREKQ